MELYYRRAESTHKGKLIPARVETVVLFLPDVWSCLPTRLEWDSLQVAYKKQLDRILKVDNQDVVADDESAAAGGGADEKASNLFLILFYLVFFRNRFLQRFAQSAKVYFNLYQLCQKVAFELGPQVSSQKRIK